MKQLGRKQKPRRENDLRFKRRSKTYEEIYGKEKAKKWKENLSIARIGEKNSMFGRKGELAPRWRGGIAYEPYDCGFTKEFKNLIRRRDNQICMNCGIHREKIKRALSIHHIDYDKKLTIPENCISLCDICHTLTNNNRKYWQSLFQEKLSKFYNYKYSDDGKIILEVKKENG